MHHFRRRLSYANVLASLSLFLALGGGAYAAGAQTSAKTGPRITTVSVSSDAAGTLVARAGGVRLQMAASATPWRSATTPASSPTTPVTERAALTASKTARRS